MPTFVEHLREVIIDQEKLRDTKKKGESREDIAKRGFRFFAIDTIRDKLKNPKDISFIKRTFDDMPLKLPPEKKDRWFQAYETLYLKEKRGMNADGLRESFLTDLETEAHHALLNEKGELQPALIEFLKNEAQFDYLALSQQAREDVKLALISAYIFRLTAIISEQFQLQKEGVFEKDSQAFFKADAKTALPPPVVIMAAVNQKTHPFHELKNLNKSLEKRQDKLNEMTQYVANFVFHNKEKDQKNKNMEALTELFLKKFPEITVPRSRKRRRSQQEMLDDKIFYIMTYVGKNYPEVAERLVKMQPSIGDDPKVQGRFKVAIGVMGKMDMLKGLPEPEAKPHYKKMAS